MGEAREARQLPKEVQIMYKRLPEELRLELDAMPTDKTIQVLEGLNKFHQAMEAGGYMNSLCGLFKRLGESI